MPYKLKMKLALVVCLLLCCSGFGNAKRNKKTVSATKMKPPTSKISITRKPALKLYHLLRGSPYDIIHIIDGSGSLDEDDHDDAKEAAQMINWFYHSQVPFGVGGSRCALIKFSSFPLTQIVFHFTTYTTIAQINSAIGGLIFDNGGRTAIGWALYFARFEFIFFPSSNRMIAWLITDGRNNVWSKDPEDEADKLKDMGVLLCIVGIGNYIDQDALESLAGLKPNGERCLLIFGTVRAYKKAVKKALRKVKKDRQGELRDLKRALRRKA